MPLAKSTPPMAEAGIPHPVRELIQVFGLVQRIMEPYFAQFGISGSQWGVLRNLYRAERADVASLRVKELSSRLLIRPPSVTGVIDRLERAGLVVRDGSPTDLRAKQVALTDQGRHLVERVLAVHQKQIDAVLGGLSAAEQAEFHRLLVQMERHLEGLLVRGPVADLA